MTHCFVSAAVSLSLCLIASATLCAQAPVQLRGRVTDGSAAGCYYCPGFAHVFKYTGTRLQSSTVNLNTFMDQDVMISGTWNGTFVTVTSAQVVPESFSLSGGGTIGGRFDLNSHGTPGGVAMNLVALGSGLSIPVANVGMQLNSASVIVHGIGVLDSTGEFDSQLNIPNVPGLIGLRLFGQGAILPQTGTLYSTNADAKEVR